MCCCLRGSIQFICPYDINRGGPGCHPRAFFEKLYAIWYILIMPYIYSVSFEEQHFSRRCNTYQPFLSFPYHCPTCHNEWWILLQIEMSKTTITPTNPFCPSLSLSCHSEWWILNESHFPKYFWNTNIYFDSYFTDTTTKHVVRQPVTRITFLVNVFRYWKSFHKRVCAGRRIKFQWEVV